MQVKTTRFGTIDVAEEEIVRFTDGLPGFRGARSMVLIGAGHLAGTESVDGQHSLFWLQDVADPDLAFLTTVPWIAYPDYDFEIDPSDVHGAAQEDLSVLAMVTVRREDDTVRLTTNLLAPIVIDAKTRVGQQLILQDSDWPIHAPLADALPSGRS
jgi:flagellar assembly factor FliW